MVGLSASELQAETLFPGDTIEYFSIAFVAGDARGHRLATVLRVDHTEDEFPIEVDTQELLPLTMMLKRKRDRNGVDISSDDAKWRKLRTFRLVDGEVEGETRADRLNAGLKKSVADAMKATTKHLAAKKQDQSCVRGKRLMSMFLTKTNAGSDKGETSRSQRSSFEEDAKPGRKTKRKRVRSRDETGGHLGMQPFDKLTLKESRGCEMASRQSRYEDAPVRSSRLMHKYDSQKNKLRNQRRSNSTSKGNKTVCVIPKTNQLSISRYFCVQHERRQPKKKVVAGSDKSVNRVQETKDINAIEAQKRCVWGLDEYYALDAEKKALEASVSEGRGTARGDASASRAVSPTKTSSTRQRANGCAMKGESDALRSWLKHRSKERRQGDLEAVKHGALETSQQSKYRLPSVASDKLESRTKEVTSIKRRHATHQDFRHRKL
ncbi:unnamed protein product [Hyaloperonospora brassicae]|uniref:Uncharacterized protein n=1 Tax=Hyaloperonospora brassicae TaxID=162125 RepID=A0AAV0UE97_HYABA|nr:unnamed protein product [Hyaloperonospora brassicae]